MVVWSFKLVGFVGNVNPNRSGRPYSGHRLLFLRKKKDVNGGVGQDLEGVWVILLVVSATCLMVVSAGVSSQPQGKRKNNSLSVLGGSFSYLGSGISPKTAEWKWLLWVV
uniref:Uncharacterized protein n=1 Tax=Solanum lycopersicum TaxID=4081 RepID=A0A3Q7IZD2_SOLLC